MKMKISARFKQIFDFELNGKRSRADPSRAENPSARAMARASSARAHHYQVVILFTGTNNQFQKLRILNVHEVFQQ